MKTVVKNFTYFIVGALMVMSLDMLINLLSNHTDLGNIPLMASILILVLLCWLIGYRLVGKE